VRELSLHAMLIRKLGEFGLIKRVTQGLRNDSSVIRGTGDDCAVLKFNRRYYELFTCDMIVEGVDFKPGDDPALVGRKALAVSLSDIAACCGIPRHAVVAMGLPKNMTVERVEKICRGMFALAREFKVNIVGGDVSRNQRLTIDVSMTGLVEKKLLALRSGAKTGDFIFVSGALGGSISGKHLTFTPRVKEARFLAENFKINSMIDISDGLAQDLGHILERSSCGAVIYADLIPLARAAKSPEDALYSGEDFELLFTLPRREAVKLMALRKSIFHPIGQIREKRSGLRLIDRNCRERVLSPRGYRHF
jgi:thiamine-monophosphate kinase